MKRLWVCLFLGCLSGFSSAVCDGYNLTILTPANGTNVFFPHTTINTTFYLSGNVNNSCGWVINDNALNNWTCYNGTVNSEMITYPQGYPVTLTVYVFDFCGNITAKSEFDVYYIHGSRQTALFVLMYGMIILVLLWRMWRKRKAIVLAGDRE